MQREDETGDHRWHVCSSVPASSWQVWLLFSVGSLHTCQFLICVIYVIIPMYNFMIYFNLTLLLLYHTPSFILTVSFLGPEMSMLWQTFYVFCSLHSLWRAMIWLFKRLRGAHVLCDETWWNSTLFQSVDLTEQSAALWCGLFVDSRKTTSSRL